MSKGDPTQLPVPYLPDAYDVSVVEAILAFYDQKYSLPSLLQYLHTHDFGSTVTEMADCLVHHGVTATIVSGNPDFFNRTSWLKILRHKGEGQAEANTGTGQSSEFERVMEKGVQLLREVPNVRLIDQELQKNQPVITFLRSSTFFPTEVGVLHYVLLAGEEDSDFICVNTLPHRQSLKINKSLIIQDILNIDPNDPNTGSIILTGKKAGT